VAVRNAFEHFDERLDKLVLGILEGTTDAVLIDSNLGPKDRLFAAPGQTYHFLRHFDPRAATVSVLDAELDLRPLLEDVQRLHDQASAALAR
jgi:hypothetical protein